MEHIKVAIITHPLQYNYGGVLQAYALSTVLKKYYEDVIVLRHSYFSLKDFVKIVIESFSPFHKFKRNYINEKIFVFKDLEKKLQHNNIDTIVVGSDQVWRRDFALSNLTFGQFLSDESSMKVFSYGASFGNDKWEYNDEETREIKKYISNFCNVSVREKTGQELCRTYLDVEAKWVLDPTMLLGPEIYRNFVRKSQDKFIFCYLLDYESPFNQAIMNELSDLYSNPVKTTRLIKNRLLKRITPTLSIQGWLSNIYNAEIILTDSFHGCVFCILFNKPFYVLENDKGGNTRIMSLLDYFGLVDRLIRPDRKFIINNIEIDWDTINKKLDDMRTISFDYITQSIKKCHDKN